MVGANLAAVPTEQVDGRLMRSTGAPSPYTERLVLGPVGHLQKEERKECFPEERTVYAELAWISSLCSTSGKVLHHPNHTNNGFRQSPAQQPVSRAVRDIPS